MAEPLNQCDGCRANVETYTREGITYHVMGKYPRNRFFGVVTDLMICERGKYESESLTPKSQVSQA